MNRIQKFVFFLGRLCFSTIFIIAGTRKILDWNGTEQLLVNQMLDMLGKSYHHEWARNLFDQLLPLSPTLLVLGTIAELGGGLLVLTGIQVRLGALMLCCFLIPTTFLFHNFWDYEGIEFQNQMWHFMKNLAIFGGGLTLLAFGGGAKKKIKKE